MTISEIEKRIKDWDNLLKDYHKNKSIFPEWYKDDLRYFRSADEKLLKSLQKKL